MKTLLIEQHQAILLGLKSSLDTSCFNFQVDSFTELESAELPADILLSEVIVLGVPHNLPLLFTWINKIRQISKYVPILVFGVDKDSPVIERLMTEPIQAIVTLQYEFEKFPEALNFCASQESKSPLQFGFRHSRYNDFSMNELSNREVEIVDLIANERTTQEISHELNISISTVENHRKNIFRKMGVRNLAGMVMNATKVGYIA